MITFLFIICYIIATFGICELIIYFDGPFKIIYYFRSFMHRLSENTSKIVDCFACLSTWVGIILSLIDLMCSINFTPFNILIDGGWKMCWLIIPLDAAFTCGTTWLLHQLEDYLERGYYYEEENGDDEDFNEKID